MHRFFFAFRTKFQKNYSGLFIKTSQITTEEKEEINKDSSNNFTEKWNWYSIIRELAGGDLLKFEAITELNVYVVFNELAYQKELKDYKKEIEYLSRGGR